MSKISAAAEKQITTFFSAVFTFQEFLSICQRYPPRRKSKSQHKPVYFICIRRFYQYVKDIRRGGKANHNAVINNYEKKDRFYQ
ncbi:MAG: hypothetical protein U0V03_02230 [Bacteroidia bacterium]